MKNKLTIIIVIMLLQTSKLYSQPANLIKVNPLANVDPFTKRVELGFESKDILKDRFGLQLNMAFIYKDSHFVFLSPKEKLSTAKGFKVDLATKYYLKNNCTYIGVRTMCKRVQSWRETEFRTKYFLYYDYQKAVKIVNTLDFIFGHLTCSDKLISMDIYSGFGIRSIYNVGKRYEFNPYFQVEEKELKLLPNFLLGATISFNLSKRSD